MPVRVVCPACKTPLTIPDELAGQKVRCGKCPQVFVASSPPAPKEAAEVKEPSPKVCREKNRSPEPAAREPEVRKTATNRPGTVLPAPKLSAGGSGPPVSRHKPSPRPSQGPFRKGVFLAGMLVGMLLVSAAWGGVWWWTSSDDSSTKPVPVTAKAGGKKAAPILLASKESGKASDLSLQGHDSVSQVNQDDRPVKPKSGQEESKNLGAAREPKKEAEAVVKEPKKKTRPVARKAQKEPERVVKKPNKEAEPVVREPKKETRPIARKAQKKTERVVKEPKKEAEPVARETKKTSRPTAKKSGPAIKPPDLGKDRLERPLAGTVGAVAAGGSGRFLILHLPQQRKLAVFDANEGRVVKYLGVSEDNVQFSASQDKLVVYLPTANVFQRWDLLSLQREVAAANPLKGTLRVLAMGSASRGPLVLVCVDGRQSRLAFLDPQTFKEVKYQAAGGKPWYPINYDSCAVRVGPNGRVIALWTPHSSPTGMQTLLLEGKTVKQAYEHTSVGHILPGPDGQTLFTGAGLFNVQLKSLNKQGGACCPAGHGPFYLAIRLKGPRFQENRPVLMVHMLGVDQPLLTFEDLDEVNGLFDPLRRSLQPLEGHLHLIPDANLLVTLPATKDRLILRRLDLDKALDKSGVDYLLVTSRPSVDARRGTVYAYQVVVKSKQGGLKYRLESGPEGMAISKDGKLTWQVPADYTADEADILVAVTDRSDQETFQAFRLAVSGDKLRAAKDSKAVVKVAVPRDKPAKEEAVRKEAAGAKKSDPLAGNVEAEASFELASFGGWVLLPDGRTLVVSSPTNGELVYIDTFKNKELRRVELSFKPASLVLQNGQLFVATQGASAVHVLDPETAKELKTLKVPGDPLKELACHPSKGPLFAVTQGDLVIAIDPASGKAVQTVGRGQHLAVDPVDGEVVYTAVQSPIRDRLNIRRGARGSVELRVTQAGRFGLLLKYKVTPSKTSKKLRILKLVSANDAAAINGLGLHLSPDGKTIAMIGGGGWQSKTSPRQQYVIALYSSKDLKTMLGQVDTGPYPASLALHPVLGIGAAGSYGKQLIHVFSGKSFAVKQKVPVPEGHPNHLTFVGRGTKVACVALKVQDGSATLKLIPLELKDEDRDALKKAQAEN